MPSPVSSSAWSAPASCWQATSCGARTYSGSPTHRWPNRTPRSLLWGSATDVPGIMRRAREDPPDQGLEARERLPFIAGIEGALVPVRAKVPACLIPGMAAESIAPVAVAARVMGVVVRLEQPVLFDDPGHFRPHVRPKDAGGYLGMVVRRKFIADVVDERRRNKVIIGAVPERTRRSLQGMLETAHRISLKCVIQLAERAQNDIGKAERVFALGSVEEFVVLAGAVLHALEADDSSGGGVHCGPLS